MWHLVEGVIWTGLGLILYQFMPDSLPRILGRSLYWIGVPLQVFTLARTSDFAQTPWLPPLTVITMLVLGLGVALLCLLGLQQASAHWLEALRQQKRSRQTQIGILKHPYLLIIQLQTKLIALCKKVWPKNRHSQGSFILASMLGNTIFIGLAIAPSLVNHAYLGWIVIYGVVNYLLGSYGVGVMLASYFGRSQQQNTWSTQLRDVLVVPALWAFGIGLLARPISLPVWIDQLLHASLLTGVPAVFLLLGMQLGKLQGVKGLQVAFFPVAIKMLILPALAGLGLTILGISGDARLSLVLMSGMPTNSANLILAEEYQLDGQLAAGSILMSTVSLPIMIPLWQALFH